MKVLVICSGNICRSPLAAAYLKKRASDAGLAHLVVDSGGTLGITGSGVPVESLLVGKRNGLDLTGHRSKGISEHAIRTSDLVIGMEEAHLDFVRRRYRPAHPELRLLRAFEAGSEPIDGVPSVPDPVGRDLDAFERCFSLMQPCLDHLVIALRDRDRRSRGTDG